MGIKYVCPNCGATMALGAQVSSVKCPVCRIPMEAQEDAGSDNKERTDKADVSEQDKRQTEARADAQPESSDTGAAPEETSARIATAKTVRDSSQIKVANPIDRNARKPSSDTGARRLSTATPVHKPASQRHQQAPPEPPRQSDFGGAGEAVEKIIEAARKEAEQLTQRLQEQAERQAEHILTDARKEAEKLQEKARQAAEQETAAWKQEAQQKASREIETYSQQKRQHAEQEILKLIASARADAEKTAKQIIEGAEMKEKEAEDRRKEAENNARQIIEKAQRDANDLKQKAEKEASEIKARAQEEATRTAQRAKKDSKHGPEQAPEKAPPPAQDTETTAPASASDAASDAAPEADLLSSKSKINLYAKREAKFIMGGMSFSMLILLYCVIVLTMTAELSDITKSLTYGVIVIDVLLFVMLFLIVRSHYRDGKRAVQRHKDRLKAQSEARKAENGAAPATSDKGLSPADRSKSQKSASIPAAKGRGAGTRKQKPVKSHLKALASKAQKASSRVSETGDVSDKDTQQSDNKKPAAENDKNKSDVPSSQAAKTKPNQRDSKKPLS